MKTSPKDLLERLQSAHDAESRLLALKAIKNSSIGNKKQKQGFVKAGVPQLVTQLLAEGEPGLVVQAAAAIGSFAATEEGLQAVVASGAMPLLLQALQSKDDKVVEAAVRALKAIFKSPLAPREQVTAAGPAALHKLVALLSAPGSNLSEAAAAVLAACCGSREQQDAVAAAGAVGPLVALLGCEGARSRQEAALEALAALSAGNQHTAGAVLQHPPVLRLMLQLLKPACQPHTRYMACVCLANLSAFLPMDCPYTKQELQQAVLPVLVRLLGETGVHEDVPGVLCQLVVESEELQKAATDVDAISKLAGFVREASCPPKLREGALRALSTLCADREEHRRQLVECKVLPQLTAALSDTEPGVRAAACACLRSLSRSTRMLRGKIGEVEVAAPLLLLSADPDPGVAAQATATLANIALEFSTVKQQLVFSGGVQRFAALADSMDQQLRLHGTWALSSITFLSQPEVKEAVVKWVPWPTIEALLADPEPDVRERAMLLLQNMAYCTQQDIDRLFAWSGGTVLEVVRRAMEQPNAGTQLKRHALKVVSNAASSRGANQAAIMAAGWPAVLAAALQHEDSVVQEAAVWAVLNLTWQRDEADEGLQERVQAFRQLGVEEQLRALQSNTSLPVRERAAHALEQFQDFQAGGAAAAAAAGMGRLASAQAPPLV